MSDYSFCDIDGNDIFENDFGLFLSAGKMRYGMLCGKRVITERGTLLNFSEAYKLNDENLSKKQFEHKKNVQTKYDEYHSKKETKKKLSRIAAKDLEIGQAYIALNTEIYLYCGHGTVNYKLGSTDYNPETGFIYIKIGNCDFMDIANLTVKKEYIKNYILADMLFSHTMPMPIVLKSRKNFIAKSNYHSPIVKKYFEYSYSDFYTGWLKELCYKSSNKLLKFSID